MKKKIIIAAVSALVLMMAVIYFAFPGVLYRGFISLDRHRAGLTEKSVQVDDHRIAYLEGGSGQTVLLIHGFSGEKDHWTRFARHLRSQYHLIIPDVPGFGESSKLESARYDIGSQTKRLERFLEILKIDSFHVAGNSMGGRIAGQLAVKDSGRVLTLALFDSSGVKPPKKSPHQLAWDKGKNLLLVENADDYDRVMKLAFSKPIWLPGPVKKYFAEKAVRDWPFNHKIEEDMRTVPVELEQELGRIKARTLILWGDDDRILDMSAVKVFERGIADHRTVIMKQCGHMPMLERPEEAAKHYLEFLKEMKQK
jgi:abhydrolase domain-containing protein 6